MKGDTMTMAEMRKVLETELECVNRKDTPKCGRNCKDCDLALPSLEVRSAYERVIGLLMKEATQ